MRYTFTIPGPCVAKERPRVGKYGNVYTPSATKAYEKKVSQMALLAKVPELSGPLRVRIVAHFTDKSKKPVAVAPMITGADVDNMAKAVLDGLKGCFNDRQVYRLEATKLIGKGQDFTDVEIEEYERDDDSVL
ncbi:MAG: RusA family crossover junction endodeoxyribonuclease [Candidatus Krumholzibacteria bacterium]|nr:RusA family crossover junction endodeoxyribonuclease [Candidatus Krumholzibacteria bacterium]